MTRKTVVIEHPAYVTVIPMGVSFQPVLLTWDRELGAYDVYVSGPGTYSTRGEAEAEAQSWALNEAVEYRSEG